MEQPICEHCLSSNVLVDGYGDIFCLDCQDVTSPKEEEK